MKGINQVSALMLEQYLLDELSAEKRKFVEEALAQDLQLASRYEALKKSNDELKRVYPLESLPQLAPFRNEIVQFPTTGSPFPDRLKRAGLYRGRFRKKQLVWGLCAAALVLCVLIPAFFYLKNSGLNKENEIAAKPGTEIETTEDFFPDNDGESASSVKEKDATEDNTKKTVKPGPETGKLPETQQTGIARETTIKDNTEIPSEGIAIAAGPETDTGLHARGSGGEQQGGVITPSEQESNITIPPGLTFIFENMFANKQLSAVVIPGRITSIGKNAFSGNPLLSVTIGANVAVDDQAFPGNFASAYNNYGKAAGTYTRPDTSSDIWQKN